MKSILILLCVLLVLGAIHARDRVRTASMSNQLKCEPLKIKICRRLNYNQTVFPNFAHHRTQYEAHQTMRTIAPLLRSGCSSDLLYLACAYYAPVCTSYGIMVPPCRSLCRKAKSDCMPVMKKLYGKIDWPSVWNCTNFPRGKKNKICFGRPQQRKRNKNRAFYL